MVIFPPILKKMSKDSMIQLGIRKVKEFQNWFYITLSKIKRFKKMLFLFYFCFISVGRLTKDGLCLILVNQNFYTWKHNFLPNNKNSSNMKNNNSTNKVSKITTTKMFKSEGLQLQNIISIFFFILSMLCLTRHLFF